MFRSNLQHFEDLRRTCAQEATLVQRCSPTVILEVLSGVTAIEHAKATFEYLRGGHEMTFQSRLLRWGSEMADSHIRPSGFATRPRSCSNTGCVGGSFRGRASVSAVRTFFSLLFFREITEVTRAQGQRPVWCSG